MYETGTVVLETDQDSSEPDNVRSEQEQWAGALTALVGENANVLVRAPWMGNAVSTLTEAMTAYPFPQNMTGEDEPFLISVVQQLLADRAIETQENEGGQEERADLEEEPEEKVDPEINIKAINKEEQKTSNPDTPQDRQSEAEAGTSEAPVRASSVVQENGQTKITGVENSESKRPIHSPVKAEATASSSDASPSVVARASNNTNIVPRVVAVSSDASRGMQRESTTIKAGQEFIPKPHPIENASSQPNPPVSPKLNPGEKAAPEIMDTDIEWPATDEPKPDDPIPVPNTHESMVEPEAEAPALLEVSSVSVEPIVMETSEPDHEIVVIPDDVVEPDSQIIESVEVEPILEAIDLQPYVDGIMDFVEGEEVIMDYLGETTPDTEQIEELLDVPALGIIEDNLEAGDVDTILQVDNDHLDFSAPAETKNAEWQVHVSVPIEGIEDTLTQISELIEIEEPEVTEKIYEILDKIIEVSIGYEDKGRDIDIDNEGEAQRELEELFVELLDELGIEHTPELIESLAYLTLKWHLVTEIENLKIKEENDYPPQDTGTHEVINVTSVGLNNFRRTTSRASIVGRSVFQLLSR